MMHRLHYFFTKRKAFHRDKQLSMYKRSLSCDFNEKNNPYLSSQQLLLLFVAYHPSQSEVDKMQDCLAKLSPQIGYAVVVNDYCLGEPVDQLRGQAKYFLTNKDNLGYGRAINQLVLQLNDLTPYIAVLNTDLTWEKGTFEKLLIWLYQNTDVCLAVPQILDENGVPQLLCKQNPTVLGLFSRRFIPDFCKPNWLKLYDRWYVMGTNNYDQVFEVPYLSGCCMLISTKAFLSIGGFDERYFLYLEDADITRCLSREGLCVHLPIANVVHTWGRGNYKNRRLLLANLVSAWHYFCKWGLALW